MFLPLQLLTGSTLLLGYKFPDKLPFLYAASSLVALSATSFASIDLVVLSRRKQRCRPYLDKQERETYQRFAALHRFYYWAAFSVLATACLGFCIGIRLRIQIDLDLWSFVFCTVVWLARPAFLLTRRIYPFYPARERSNSEYAMFAPLCSTNSTGTLRGNLGVDLGNM